MSWVEEQDWFGLEDLVLDYYVLKEELSKRNHSNKNSDEQFEKAWNSKMAQLEMKYEETL